MLRSLAKRAAFSAFGVLGLTCFGCPSMQPLPSQAPVQEMRDEEADRPYLLYVPSTYNAKRSWPLLVACHGTPPYDTAELEMREWASFGEDKGIVIVCPKLRGTRGDFPPAPEKQISLQREDEQHILNVVKTVKQRYTIAEEQVFLTGWSAGAYAILYTGLRHPEIFRALAIRQGSFDQRFMDIPEERMDRWQPVKVVYGSTDIIRDQTKECIKWLRDRNMYVDEEEIPGAHRRIDPRLVWKFFATTVKERPWVRIRTRPTNGKGSGQYKFEIDSIPPAQRVRWFFGDNTQSWEPAPVHQYKEPGRYEVAVNVLLKGGKKYTRKRIVHVKNTPSGETAEE